MPFNEPIPFSDNFEKFKTAYNSLKLQRYGNPKDNIVAMDFSTRLEVDKVEPLDKGCLIWIKGEAFPIRSALNNQKILTVTQIKRIIVTLLEAFKGNIFKKFFSAIFLAFNWSSYIDFMYHYMSDTFMDIDRYSQPVREAFRVFSKIHLKIAWVLISILEFDMAYRYKWQDTIVLINKEAFYKNPLKEFRRVMDIAIGRDYEAMQNKYRLIKLVGSLALIFSSKLRSQLKEIIRDLDFNELKMSKEDIYWTSTLPYSTCLFGGVSYKIRKQNYEELKFKTQQNGYIKRVE